MVMLEQNIVLLLHRLYYSEVRAREVSVSKHNGDYMMKNDKALLTLLVFNACARCCAPSAPIPLPERSSSMSV